MYNLFHLLVDGLSFLSVNDFTYQNVIVDFSQKIGKCKFFEILLWLYFPRSECIINLMPTKLEVSIRWDNNTEGGTVY